MQSSEADESGDLQDTEYTDWMGIASRPNWIKWLCHEKRDLLCLADAQVNAVKQLVGIMMEARAIRYSATSSEQESDEQTIVGAEYLARQMCHRGLLTGEQEAFFIREFYRNSKPSAFYAIRSRVHRHLLDIDDDYWRHIEPAVELVPRNTASPADDAYWEKGDEIAYACMTPKHRQNWQRLLQPVDPPSSIPKLPPPVSADVIFELSPTLGSIESSVDTETHDRRRSPSSYFPSPRTKRELLVELTEIVGLGLSWITLRTKGPFLNGDPRNTDEGPVKQTRRLFAEFADELARRGILGQ